MKHAYLILAHNEFDVLAHLVSALDDVRNAIFIHIDKKVTALPDLRVKHAALYFIPERIDVRWGDLSVVEAEYALFHAAYKEDSFGYYHLLSGVDMPLQTQDRIHDFFDNNVGKQFIGYSQYDYSGEIELKMHRTHLFSGYFREGRGWQNMARRVIRALAIRFQSWLSIRKNKAIDFKKGTQWISVTHDFVTYLLSKEQEVYATYTHTFCPDEVFAQTLCWYSPYRETIYCVDEEATGCMRAIKWRDNQVYSWTLEEVDGLLASGKLFARKFSVQNGDALVLLRDRISS